MSGLYAISKEFILHHDLVELLLFIIVREWKLLGQDATS
jgi:hypothetical protein